MPQSVPVPVRLDHPIRCIVGGPDTDPARPPI
jgi:hypothetical protein